ncbi:RebB family R body protein [Pseudomonadota bacterium]
MAFPTSVNSQVTDAVDADGNQEGIGVNPAFKMGELYITTMHALSTAAYEAVQAQQQANITYQSATAAAVSALLGKGGEGAPYSTDASELNAQQLDRHIEMLKQQLKQAKALQKSVKKGEK